MKTIGIAGPIQVKPLLTHINNAHRDSPTGVAGTAIHHIVNELIRRGDKVIIFTVDPDITKPTTLNGNLLKIHISPYRTRYKARDFFAVERKFLLENMKKENVELIHAHWTYEFAWAALDSGKPTLITVRDAPLRILRYDRTPFRLIKTIMGFITLSKAKNINANSPYIASYLKKIHGWHLEIPIIPNGYPIPNILSEHRNSKKGDLIFGAMLNGWGKLKNSATLLSAFSTVKQKLENSSLWLYGKGHGKNEAAESWAKQKNMTRGVRFLGDTEHNTMMESITKDFDIIVHPSLEESFGNAILEGLMLGIPVIGGASSGAVPYVLGYGKAGMLTNVKSASALAESMLMLAKDRNLRDKLGFDGRNFAINNFNIEKVVDKYQELYKQI